MREKKFLNGGFTERKTWFPYYGGGGFSSPAELKHQITEALLSLSKTPGWSQRFERWRLLGYAKVDESFFDREDVVVERVRGLSIAPAYY